MPLCVLVKAGLGLLNIKKSVSSIFHINLLQTLDIFGYSFQIGKLGLTKQEVVSKKRKKKLSAVIKSTTTLQFNVAEVHT